MHYLKYISSKNNCFFFFLLRENKLSFLKYQTADWIGVCPLGSEMFVFKSYLLVPYWAHVTLFCKTAVYQNGTHSSKSISPHIPKTNVTCSKILAACNVRDILFRNVIPFNSKQLRIALPGPSPVSSSSDYLFGFQRFVRICFRNISIVRRENRRF